MPRKRRSGVFPAAAEEIAPLAEADLDLPVGPSPGTSSSSGSGAERLGERLVAGRRSRSVPAGSQQVPRPRAVSSATSLRTSCERAFGITSTASPAAAAVVSEPMIEPRNTPCCQLYASVTSGTVLRAAAAEQDRRDRHAVRVFPLGRDARHLRRAAR